MYVLCTYITGGMDYDSGPYAITFPAMQASASFNVPLANDNTFEGN